MSHTKNCYSSHVLAQLLISCISATCVPENEPRFLVRLPSFVKPNLQLSKADPAPREPSTETIEPFSARTLLPTPGTQQAHPYLQALLEVAVGFAQFVLVISSDLHATVHLANYERPKARNNKSLQQ